MGIDTHKVEIVPVMMEKHPDADSLSVVKVYNFTVVVKTSDWEGMTKAAYVQPDSVLPDTSEYRWLKITGNVRRELDALNGLEGPSIDRQRAAIEAEIDANTKRLRVTVQRLRGVLSMGLLLPIPECQLCKDDLRTLALSGPPTLVGKYHELGTQGQMLCTNCAEIGDDLAAILGITHYDPPTADELDGRRSHAGADVASAPPMIYAPEYDVESVYKYADCFEPGEPVYVTEKLDGQNARFVATESPDRMEDTPGGQRKRVSDLTVHAGSRTEWKKEEGNSNWWRVVNQNPWIKEWCLNNPGKVLYGETFGWVQNLKYGAKPGQLWFRAFDILDGMEYLGADAFTEALRSDLRVPSLGIMPFDFEKLQKLADGPSLILGANHMREGIVVKPVKERRHWKLGRIMVKVVSNAYLEKSSR